MVRIRVTTRRVTIGLLRDPWFRLAERLLIIAVVEAVLVWLVSLT
jgi:hypothetical protein